MRLRLDRLRPSALSNHKWRCGGAQTLPHGRVANVGHGYKAPGVGIPQPSVRDTPHGFSSGQLSDLNSPWLPRGRYGVRRPCVSFGSPPREHPRRCAPNSPELHAHFMVRRNRSAAAAQVDSRFIQPLFSSNRNEVLDGSLAREPKVSTTPSGVSLAPMLRVLRPGGSIASSFQRPTHLVASLNSQAVHHLQMHCVPT